MFKVLTLVSLLSVSLTNADQIDLQINMAGTETIYDSQGSDQFALKETITQRTGQWRCIAKNNQGKVFVSYYQEQTPSIMKALKKCKAKSDICIKVSCNTN